MTEPTDAELDMLIDDVAGLDSSNEAFRKFARAVLTKWGTPPAVAVEPVAWYEYNADLDAWFLAYNHNPKAKTRPLAFGDTSPQPTQAQAEAVPLTEQQIHEMWYDQWDGFASFAEAEVIVRATEEAHGIKGGQHGL